MSADVLEKPDTRTTDSNGDHDKFAHYARKTDIERAVFEGATITALCGKQWRPEGDFASFPVCPTCEERYAALSE